MKQEKFCPSHLNFSSRPKRKIFTKPMKGTIKRDKDPIKDEENKIFLQNDTKI